MPRQSVPTDCKKMRTLDVNVTKTTEEEIWNHLHNKLLDIQRLDEEAKRKQNELIDLVFDRNPYTENNWRKHPPKRIEFLDWTNNDDKWYTYMRDIAELKHDYALYFRIFVVEDYVISNIEYDISRIGMNDSDLFKTFEQMRFKQAKAEWELKDADWIAEKKLKETHIWNHKSAEIWERIQQQRKEGFYYPDHPYEIKIIDTRVSDCKYCMKEIEDEKQRLIRQVKEEQEFEESERKWKQQKELEKKEELNSRHLYSCPECNFNTYDETAWDAHEETKDHKKLIELKKFLCNECSVQCRNQMEYTIHMQTKKHKIAVGLIEKVTEFRCEACNYITNLKQNYDKHILTKNHIEKTK